MKGQQYTATDKQTIIKYITDYPQNLQKAFRLASIELRRTQKSIGALWYNKLRHDKQLFNLNSSTSTNINTKNIYKKKSTNNTIEVSNGVINLGNLVITGNFRISV